jgi:pimeloyl-ACP methyl ester carboxylesterase
LASHVLVKQAQDLATFVRRGAQEGSSFDEVQRGVFHRLLDMGQAAVGLFLAPQGDGNLGPRVEVENGKTLYRSDTTVTRLLRTIFGEHVVEAYVYSAGNKRKIELRPIDARINLPHGKASYLLQEFSAGLRIPSGTPPVFLVHGGDDLISPPEHSVFMYLALKRAGIPAELHIYANTAHDFAVRPGGRPYAAWTESCARWLRDQGFLGGSRK